MPLPSRDNLPSPASRDREDELDWQENQRRSPEDQHRVDGAFLLASVAGTTLWLITGLGAVGGVIAAGVLIARFWLR